ncbi:uncharacterized protein N7482_007649 [Penicillium canariense]|uniref:Xylanolytic transcriptional activator regulatory domain-containing protein n=1 Tax=Penicillium canariense TaxID=189055 RepID=A0A9W9I238_9EURO|nr:uncharacterized protein N7482_007649 [Penicillium canariense]KAJ5160645.1 hypothetical protein N7482_007649 [Penicillium canariense]
MSVPTASPATSNASTTHFQDLVKSVEDVVVEPSRQPRFLGQSSGITLARLVMAAIHVDDLPSLASKNQTQSYNPCYSPPAAEASLPPRHAADHLVEVYFQYRTCHLPIVGRPQAEKAIENAYRFLNGHEAPDRESERDIFTIYMILAIALCDVTNSSGGRPSQSEGCFRSAIGWIERVITYADSDLDTVRSVLLLAQFVALCPSWGSLWHLTGTALRLCIDIGLHWETEEQTLHMNPEVLHDRRCLWYSTYQLDRVLCLTLGRPFGIIDESTRVQFPNPWTVPCRPCDRGPNEYDIHHQRAHNHLFSMSKMVSEIRHVLHSHQWPRKLAYPRVNYSAWIQEIRPRLQEWYSTIPQLDKASPASIFACQAYWDAIYHNTVLFLYRPNSIVLHTSVEELVSFDASCKLIASIKILQREGKIDILWEWVHHLFMSGLTVIYDLWRSKEIRDSNPVRNSISSLQSCASTLSALSESFPGAAGCRDAFETLSSVTIDRLLTENAEEVRETHLEFDKQVKNLLHNLQPSGAGMVAANDGTNHMTNMLSTDNFALGEMLSFAAQWPDFHDVGFEDEDMRPL